MTPIIIWTKSKKSFENSALKTINELEHPRVINLFNKDIFSYGKEINKISTIQLKSFLSKNIYKPEDLKNKYFLLYNFDLFNVTMQNNILKILEDSETGIFIQSSNIHTILETVLSRCKIIKIKNSVVYNKEIVDIIKQIVLKNELSFFTKIVKYDHTKILENLEYFLRKNKDSFEEKNYVESLKKLYDLKRNIKTTKGLNFELQFINVIISLLSKNTI